MNKIRIIKSTQEFDFSSEKDDVNASCNYFSMFDSFVTVSDEMLNYLEICNRHNANNDLTEKAKADYQDILKNLYDAQQIVKKQEIRLQEENYFETRFCSIRNK